MALVYAVLLGVVQGLTEFLPVSSTAHLVLAERFFGLRADLFGPSFDVACHVGTLLAVLVYFRPEIIAMVRAVPRLGTVLGPTPDPAAWMAVLIVIGTVPAVAAGLTFEHAIEARLRTPAVIAVTMAAVAFAFFAVERRGSRQRDAASLGLWDTVVIGCAQATALVPGVSRSGATIAAGMGLGLRRDEAARFGFLLGIVAILGAAVKKAWPLRHGLPPGEGPVFAIGIAASAVVGYLAIRLFLRFLTRHSLSGFAWYRLALAASVVVWWMGR